jgi:hypothetical protein
VSQLAGFLKLGKETLEQVADELGVHKSHNIDTLKQEIALKFYELGPKSLKSLLTEYSPEIDNDDLRTALEILSTYWVNPGASATILKFCRNTVMKRVFAINGHREYFTPEAYVRQICCWRKPWPVIKVGDKTSAEDILEQIREALKVEFQKNLQKSCTRDTIDPRLNELLKSRLDHFGAPVFVVLSPVAAQDNTLIEAISATYDHIRIVLCTGTSPGSEPPPGVEMLKPEFDLQIETDAWDIYDATLSLL